MARIERPPRLFRRWMMALGAACLGLVDVGHAAETCLASTIDEVGRCLKPNTKAKHAVDTQVRGAQTAPPPQPPIDPAYVATPVHGGPALGSLHHIEAGSDEDWVLLTHEAEIDGEGRLTPSGRDSAEDKIVWMTLRWPTDGTRPVVALRASALRTQLIPAESEAEAKTFPECVVPEASMNGPYDRLTGAFRWVLLAPKMRLLAAGVSRQEGYAGGGGSFEGEVLLLPENGTLRPIACYALSSYQMFGGSWNPDGTRQHPESHAAWKLSKLGRGEWPDLHLRPTTRGTPAAVLAWDGARGQYVATRGAASDTRGK